MNTEKGLRRITWVISAIGLAILVFGVVLGISLQNQFRIQFQSTERAVKNDPQWVEFSSQARSRALKLIRKDHWEGFYENSDMPIAIGLLIVGPVWFLATWGAFFTIRWIVRGFTEEPTDKKDKDVPKKKKKHFIFNTILLPYLKFFDLQKPPKPENTESE